MRQVLLSFGVFVCCGVGMANATPYKLTNAVQLGVLSEKQAGKGVTVRAPAGTTLFEQLAPGAQHAKLASMPFVQGKATQGGQTIFKLEANSRYRVVDTGGAAKVQAGDEFAVTAPGPVDKAKWPVAP